MSASDQSKTPGTLKPHDGREQAEAGTSPRRRRLLKGALSAPMILTLYSGAAIARSSNTPTIALTKTDATGNRPQEGGTATCISGGECTNAAYDPDATTYTKCDAGPSYDRHDISVSNGVGHDIIEIQRDCNSANGGVAITVSSVPSLLPPFEGASPRRKL